MTQITKLVQLWVKNLPTEAHKKVKLNSGRRARVAHLNILNVKVLGVLEDLNLIPPPPPSTHPPTLLLPLMVTWWQKRNVEGANKNTKPCDRGLGGPPSTLLAQLRPCAYLFCQPWIRLVYLLSTPSTFRACCCCCCRFTVFPNTDPRTPPAPAEPPREPEPEPEPGLCDPVRPSFLDAGFDEEELVLFVPGCGLLSVLSILATGRRRARRRRGGGVGGERRREGGTGDGGVDQRQQQRGRIQQRIKWRRERRLLN